MKYFLPILFFLIGCLLFGLVIVMQRLPQSRIDRNMYLTEDGLEHPKIKGFQLSPMNYRGDNFTDFFKINQSLGGNSVGWTGSIKELAIESAAPNVIVALADQYKYTPIISIQAFDKKTGKLLEEFITGKQVLLDFVNKHHPAYLGIGVEVNLLFDKNSKEFYKFATLFQDFGDEIHQISPKTHIFPIFQLEQIQGLKGGLFGGKNDGTANQWNLLAQFPNADFIGFTTYPALIYKSPEEMPESYYKEIFAHTAKRVIFTEIGWIRNNSIKGWDSSEAEQEIFLQQFNGQVSNERVIVKLWSFLYDQTGAEVPFNTMGFRPITKKSTDKLSPAEIYWKKM